MEKKIVPLILIFMKYSPSQKELYMGDIALSKEDFSYLFYFQFMLCYNSVLS